jgi:hypothetical protein
MKKNKSHTKTIVSLILLMILLGLFFLGGMLSYKYGFHIQGVKIIRQLAGDDTGARHFYPTPETYSLEPLFNNQDVEPPFSFIVYGHSREPASDMKSAVINGIIEEDPSFVFHMGDMVFYSDENNWRIFDLFEGQIISEDIPFYPVMGNHEYRVFNGEEYYNDREEPLKPIIERFPFLEGRTWYSFSYGGSLFIVLDTNIDHGVGSVQYNWLKDLLNETNAENTFIFLHHPVQPSSSIRTFERTIRDLLEDYQQTGLTRPDIVFTADFYDYSRYITKNIVYISTGGGGTTRNYPDIQGKGNFYKGSGKVFHYTKITVLDDEISFEMIRLNEGSNEWEIGDSFLIRKL